MQDFALNKLNKNKSNMFHFYHYFQNLQATLQHNAELLTIQCRLLLNLVDTDELACASHVRRHERSV